MNSFYDKEELLNLGLKKIGNNVLISRKCSIYSPERISIGSNVRIDDFCILSGKIVLGDYIHISAYTALYGGTKGIFVDDFATISSRVCVYASSDDYSGTYMTNPMLPNEYTNVDNREVHIKKHVIIGSTSVVLPGVVLAEGSAFGSFSFINNDSDEWSLNCGIPFRRIKDRKRNPLELEKALMKSKEK